MLDLTLILFRTDLEKPLIVNMILRKKSYLYSQLPSVPPPDGGWFAENCEAQYKEYRCSEFDVDLGENGWKEAIEV